MEDPIMASGMAPFIELLGKVPEFNNYKPYFEKIKANYLQRVRDIIEEHHFFSISTTLPFIWALKIKAFEIEDLIKQKELRAKFYSLGGFIEDVTRMLDRFDRLGYFEEL
ncbi:GL22095 [Drosophila persimilis]|uniref:GL22095 n=1 Tax=Drosophila persimilis TaxID=7234 RepID=B4GEX6_DROPE|nr:GL22095 [Drosophila persimilis]